MQYSDYELVYMVKENEEALSYMVKKYEPLFKRLAYSFVKRNPHKGLDVEDIVQQCRITMCYALEKFDSDNDVLFYSFLLVCLKRGILNYTRSYINKPDNYYYMDINDYDNLEEFTYNVDYFQNCVDSNFEDDIILFKHSLTAFDSWVFELKYNGFSYNEIANLLEVNVKKIDNTLLKVRKKLENYFLF